MLRLADVVVAMPLLLASEQDFFHLPNEHEVRVQPIARTDGERGWPFSVTSGHIACVWSAGRPLAIFVEDIDEADTDEEAARHVILSVDPIELTVLNIANRTLFAPAGSIENLIERVAPYVVIGERLCDQPPGTVLGPGEL